MIEKIKLANTVPIIQKLNYQIGNGTELFVKREDMLDFAFGGNKVRLCEYIAYQVVKQGKNKIITFGSVYSNFIRIAAALSNKLNISCELIILHDDVINEADIRRFPNLYISSKLHKAKLIYCKNSEAHEFIDVYLEKKNKEKINYLWIPGGGHTPEAVFGYYDAALEIQSQAKEMEMEFDAIFLPCGTGTTQAGLLLGFKDTKTKVIGITVARPKERCIREISKLLKQNSDDYEILVLENDKYQYGGVGEIALKNIIQELAETDQIYLDPVYNAKTFLRMTEYLKEHDGYKKVLYINTGGTPNIFLGRENE